MHGDPERSNSNGSTHVTPRAPVRIVAGAVAGLGSAALFGVSAPAAKLLLPSVDPWLLAGLLYAGAAVGLIGMRLAGRALRRATNSNDGLMRADWPLLGAITVIGGAVAPVLLLVGLQRVSGVAGSLLLNLEAVATMVLAVTVFGDSLNRREACGAALVIVGAVVLSYEPGQLRAEILGVALIAAACTCWGLDNNLTARVSRRNPVQITYIKALGAGTGNLALALAAGRSMPTVRVTAVALAIGFVCYGVSIVLDVYALRYIGPAREAAFFATAPFAGAIASVPLLGEVPSAHQLIAAALMAVGVVTVTGLRALRPG